MSGNVVFVTLKDIHMYTNIEIDSQDKHRITVPGADKQINNKQKETLQTLWL